MVPDDRPAGRWKPGSAPAYIRRPHDALLRRMLDPEVADSRLIVVRGEACTGKSRAAYEAVADRLADWRLEYPPTVAALTARLEAGIPAWTVLWLGDLRRYAEADADTGATALNLLADLLAGEGYLVITTIWPVYWDAYVAAAGARRGAGDPARAAGRLLAGLDELALVHEPDPAGGGVIDVPARFTAEELTAAAVRGDPLLAAAAAAAPDGQVTQYIAGCPGLLRRYDEPGGHPYGQAMITAAMDASRLGHTGPLPAVLIQDAAIGYLPPALVPDTVGYPPGTSAAVAHASDRVDALAWACAGLDGAAQALESVPPASHAAGASGTAGAAGTAGAGYRIASYLDQHGRRTRQDRLGPASFWDALTAHSAGTGGGDLIRVGQAARDRGLHRHAAALWTAAVSTASAGSADAARRLVAHLHEVSPEDVAPAARWAVGRVRLDDPWDLARLLEELLHARAGDAVLALLARDPARQVRIDHSWDAVELLGALHAAAAAGQADVLAARIVADVSLEHLPAVASLLAALHAAGAGDAIRALVARDPARHAIPEEPEEIAVLLEALHAAGAEDAARSLASWAANDVALERPQALARLLKALRAVGAHGAYQLLLVRDPVGHARFDDPWEAAALLAELRAAGAEAGAEAGAAEAVQALLARIPDGLGGIDYTDSVAWLLAELRAARSGHAIGADQAIAAVLARDPARHVDLYDLQAVGRLAAELRAAADIEALRPLATEALRTLATRAADEAESDDPGYLAERLEEFRAAGADPAVLILLDRDPAGCARLDDPGTVAWLLDELRAAGAGHAVQVLLARDPAGQARLDHPQGVAQLLRALRTAGAREAAASLATRAAKGVSFEDPLGTAQLLEELRAAGADDALRSLLTRDPAGQLSLAQAQPLGVARLLTALRAAGAGEAARALSERAADAGMFHLTEDRAGYRFGREPDGSAAPPWRWSAPSPDPRRRQD